MDNTSTTATGATTAASNDSITVPVSNSSSATGSNTTGNTNTNTKLPPISVQLYKNVLQTDYYNYINNDNTTNTTTDSTKKDASKLLLGAIDQGTSSTRFVLFTHLGQIACVAQIEHIQYYPQTGWHEHNPIEIYNNIILCIETVCSTLQNDCIPSIVLNTSTLSCIGITNQRETTIAWNRVSGIPYYNAIVWDCSRTSHIAEQLASITSATTSSTSSDTNTSKGTSTNKDYNKYRNETGLPISSYFAGTKVKWLLENIVQLQNDLLTIPEQICFGTIDTWILYNLTGHTKFNTDISNASRWLFCNIHTGQWDITIINTICTPYTIPLSSLPTICPSSYIYGYCQQHNDQQQHDEQDANNTTASTTNNTDNTTIRTIPKSFINIPIGSILGDQQAALFGQAAFHPGQAKNTYGTGLFLMMNTGTTPIPSTHGLLTTVAYQIGVDGPIHYALEGSVSFSGSTIQWLRDQLQIISTASESETLAATTTSNDGLYMVPAFSGLLAPYWKSTARGCIVGMSISHHKGHICRAALESTAYQTKSVFDAITADCNGIQLQSLNVDGGGTINNLLMQFQADIINVPVTIPTVMETTSIGAAFAAGLATGVYTSLDEIQSLWSISKTYTPSMSNKVRNKNWNGWLKAIERSFDWIDDTDNDNDTSDIDDN